MLTIPINKEPDLTSTFTGIQQDWSNGIMLHQVLNNEGNLYTLDNLTTPKRPIKMEYEAFEKAISRKLEMLKTYYNDDFRAFLRKAKPILGIFNIYGRIVLKNTRDVISFKTYK